jgi:sarcosine oxidase/L-pipecolate oxidase
MSIYLCNCWMLLLVIGDSFTGRPGLVVACGGSGHGFKFAPVIGDVIRDVVRGRQSVLTERFKWRAPQKQEVGGVLGLWGLA